MGVFKRNKAAPIVEDVIIEDPSDPSGFIIDNSIAQFLLCHTQEVKCMCLLGYTYLHGCKLWSKFQGPETPSFRFISLLMASFGGGILVPIFINGLPVIIAQDFFFIAVLVSFFLHTQVPMLREVASMSMPLKAFLIVMFESIRSGVVIGLITAANNQIKPSFFDTPVFGPIICGTIGGCGGAFLPLNRGLDPIKNTGLLSPMISALIGSVYYHLFVNVGDYSEDIIDANKKAHLTVTIFFIINHFHDAFNKKLKKE